jgi:hypothetical protein
MEKKIVESKEALLTIYLDTRKILKSGIYVSEQYSFALSLCEERGNRILLARVGSLASLECLSLKNVRFSVFQ